MLRCRAFCELVVTTHRLLAMFTCLLLAGCTTLAGKPTATSPCPFEQVWDTAIVALEGVRLQAADKAAGVVEAKRVGTGAAATVLQLREIWSPMGVKMNQWRAVPGNPREEAAVAAEIARRLKEKGC